MVRLNTFVNEIDILLPKKKRVENQWALMESGFN